MDGAGDGTCAGDENRPPMLDKAMYNSWESLYGQIQKKKYTELTEQEQLQDDCDVQGTKIVLQGLSPNVYALVKHCQSAKDILERVKLLVKVEFPQVDSGLVVLVFLSGYDPIACLNKAMALMQCTQPKRLRNAARFKEKLMLAEAQESGQVFDEEQLAFLADPRITNCHDVQPTTIHNAAF
uniref:Retrovirus-related Pol polyprotein from transposon TNT 1-94 n=1 Tax=Tanacetum cinerariifolium TaxID=118510 RepID=A0A699GTE5_TANCI|nr:hypothetical protein [Tanacetum cinerariifolium]